MNDTYLSTPIARHIWETKYRFIERAGGGDQTIEETWQRVASAVAAVEPKARQRWEQRFYEVLESFRFIPGGRILAGAGTGRRVTLFNCFVMGVIEDSMDSIFDHIKEGALTMQAGGGVGYDFSTLRPEGSIARATGRIASGPISFMRIWDAMCATVMSTGARRGAMIASLRCDHPDIERFINAKREPGELRHFNLSIQITDEFIKAVECNADWPLVFPAAELEGQEPAADRVVMRQWQGSDKPVACRVLKQIPARQLWDRIMRATYDTAEPGVLFVDRINRFNNLGYCEYISTTNPCGEIPLPPYGACNLGSINLTRFISEPFTSSAALDLKGLSDTTSVAVRFLDNVIDLSHFAIESQAVQARASRRIGLGITGLADALIMLGLHYDSGQARAHAALVMQTICHAAYRASIELSKERGSFPLFESDAYRQGAFIRALPADLSEGIQHHGIRNSHLTAIAPAGTISLLAGNISSGIEPVFSIQHSRRVLNRNGLYDSFELSDYAFERWKAQVAPDTPLPPQFVDSQALSPESHLMMQAALQPWVDSAISKTINVPEDYPFEAFRSLYELANEKGLKGCTTFRPNPITGEVLKATSDQEEGEQSFHCCSIEREEE